MLTVILHSKMFIVANSIILAVCQNWKRELTSSQHDPRAGEGAQVNSNLAAES